MLTAPSKAGVRVRSWGFVIGAHDCFAIASPGWGAFEDAPSGFCSGMSPASSPLETTRCFKISTGRLILYVFLII